MPEDGEVGDASEPEEEGGGSAMRVSLNRRSATRVSPRKRRRRSSTRMGLL
jgi:hypothetical protein